MTDRELMQQALDALANFDLDVRLKVIPALRARLAQPEQEWQGLTDEEIHNTGGYREDRELYWFARTIEAKLKAKNA